MEPASPSPVNPQFLLFRLRRQRRLLEKGRVDRFLDLFEALNPSEIASRLPPGSPEISECKRLIDEMIPLMESSLSRISADEFRSRVFGRIQEFLAKKEEP